MSALETLHYMLSTGSKTAKPLNAVLFYGFRVTTSDDDWLPEDAMEADRALGTGRSNLREDIEQTANLPEWQNRINVFPRNAGLLVAAMRSTEFVKLGKYPDVLNRRDEIPQWKQDLAEFCDVVNLSRHAYTVSWCLVMESGTEVVSVKLLFTDSDYGRMPRDS